MKNTFKFLVNCLLSVSFFFSLFLFPVAAEVPSTYTLDNVNLAGLIQYSDLDLSTDIVYIGNNGRLQIVSPRFGSVNITSTQVSYTGKRIEYDGSKWNDVNANGTVTLGFSWSGLYFLNIPNQQKFCKVVTNASQIPNCLNQLNWSADFNNLLSDPYIAQGVGYAREHLWDNWEISFRIYSPELMYFNIADIPMRLSVPGFYYQYQLSNLDTNETFLYEGPLQKSLYEASGGGQGSEFLVTFGTPSDSHVVLRSFWLPKSIDTSTLIDKGNFISQSASSSLNNTTSDFNDTALELESFESQFNSGMSAALGNIDVSRVDLGNVSDFVSTADFIKLQFDTILDNSGIYKSVITFSLILGLALLLIGRRS